MSIEESLLCSEVESVTGTVASWVQGDHRVPLAVDAPLGWPRALGEGLDQHRAGKPLPAEAHDLFRRITDRFVHARLGKLPLEVGADRIARTAHAALRLLDEVRARSGTAIPFAWSADFEETAAIEVYPAATLIGRRAGSTGYKGSDDVCSDHRQTILSALRKEWTLHVDPDLLASSDDRLDAAVCVLAGADFLRGRSVGPDAGQRDAAEVEGWIWFAPREADRPNRSGALLSPGGSPRDH